jgi:hypothetical protein
MKRLRVPIDRHANGQLAEVLRKIVLVVPYRRLMQLTRVGALLRFWHEREVPMHTAQVG